jgi:hypothetical protein
LFGAALNRRRVFRKFGPVLGVAAGMVKCCVFIAIYTIRVDETGATID